MKQCILCADRQEINMENGDTKLVSGLRETTFHEDGRITDKNEKINEGNYRNVYNEGVKIARTGRRK